MSGQDHGENGVDGGGQGGRDRQRTRNDWAQGFAVEEALFLAQRRAREAEEAMVIYDSKMEETVLKLLTQLDASRQRERESLEKFSEIKRQMQEHERMCEDASRFRRTAGNLSQSKSNAMPSGLSCTTEPWLDADSRAQSDDEEWWIHDDGGGSQCEGSALAAGGGASAAAAASRMESLSLSLAQAYEEIREAKEAVVHHTKLMEGLEDIVEPILEYRHRGILVDPTSPAASLLGSSSVVFVQPSDAIDPSTAQAASSESCYRLLAAKVAAEEEARKARAEVAHISELLKEAELASEASRGRATQARGTIAAVVEKVEYLLDTVRAQAAEIQQLQAVLEETRRSQGSSRRATTREEVADDIALATSPTTPVISRRGKQRRWDGSARTLPSTLIAATAEGTRCLVDACEIFLLRSIDAVAGALGKVLSIMFIDSIFGGWNGRACRGVVGAAAGGLHPFGQIGGGADDPICAH